MVSRLRDIEKALKGNKTEVFTLTIDGSKRQATFDECFSIVRDINYLNEHKVSIADGGSGNGQLADLLNELCKMEGENIL